MPEMLAAYQLLSLLVGGVVIAAIALCAFVWVVVVLANTFASVLGKFPDFVYGSVVYLEFWIWRFTKARDYPAAEKYMDRLQDRARVGDLRHAMHLLLVATGNEPGNLVDTPEAVIAHVKQVLVDSEPKEDVKARKQFNAIPLRARKAQETKETSP